MGHAVYLDEDVAWATYQYDIVYTVDGWRTSYVRMDGLCPGCGPNPTYLNDVDFIDYQHGWVGGGYPSGNGLTETGSGLIYRTKDAGQTWKQVTLPPPYRMVSYVDFVDPLIGYATAGDRNATYLIQTRNGGETWTSEIVVPSSTNFGGIHCVQSGSCWAWLGLGNTSIDGRFSLYKRAPAAPLASPTPAPPLPGCLWTGNWSTLASHGGNYGMTLSQDGTSVSGTYVGSRHIVGEAVNGMLIGRWSSGPTYAEPDHAGRFKFVMRPDCHSFTGSWGSGDSDVSEGFWTDIDAATASPERLHAISDGYFAWLAREPDQEDLIFWAGTSLKQQGLHEVLLSSGEGIRVEAVRSLYLELLGRDPLGPDKTGLRSWVDSVLAIDEIRFQLLQSKEYLNRTNG